MCFIYTIFICTPHGRNVPRGTWFMRPAYLVEAYGLRQAHNLAGQYSFLPQYQNPPPTVLKKQKPGRVKKQQFATK